MAFLVLKPTIKKATTILNYEGHVKYSFREQGCDPLCYQTTFLKQMRRGIKNVFPKQADKRGAFLLPEFLVSPHFSSRRTQSEQLVRFATVLGFIGMLRPHTFTQLSPGSFQFVLRNGEIIRHQNKQIPFKHYIDRLPPSKEVLGFFITFQSKTMTRALAYFPNLSNTSCTLSDMCPYRFLLEAARRNWIRTGFLKTQGRGQPIRKYIQLLTSSKDPVSAYSLRIGGRTWYLSQDMESEFVDYLGTWKIPKASARYYRASPAAVLKKLRKFYCTRERSPTA